MLQTLEKPHSSISEIYRRIRTNIEYSSLDQKIKVMNVTSTTAAEAKTTTACNLAVMFANKNEKVLIIDTDLRKPAVHKQFFLKNTKGLSELTIDFSNHDNDLNQIQLDEYIHKLKHEQMTYKLDVMTAGSRISNAAEFLGSNTFKLLLGELKKQYDMILLDTAPCGIIVDGVVVSSACDATLFVIEYNKNNVDMVKKTVDSLKTAGANVIGTILTKTPVKSGILYRYRKDYEYYGYDRED